jgi:Zn finger protein HypA/HybF involved in hydrogenase expression
MMEEKEQPKVKKGKIFKCEKCGKEYVFDSVSRNCPKCGGILREVIIWR